MSSSGAVEYKRREAWQDDRQRSNHSGSALADRGGFQSESTDPTRTHMHARAHTHTPHTRAHTRTHTHHTRAHTSHTRARTHTAGSVDSAQTDGPDDAAESAIWEEQYPARKGRDGAQPATRPPCPLPAYYPSRKLLSPCCYSLSVAGPYFSIPSPVSVSSPDSVPLPISSPGPDPDSPLCTRHRSSFKPVPGADFIVPVEVLLRARVSGAARRPSLMLNYLLLVSVSFHGPACVQRN